MTKTPCVSLDYYNRNVVSRIIEKYAVSPIEAARAFLLSEAHAMLEVPSLGMWDFSERAVFDMWEVERITGDPRNSVYLRSENA